MTSEGLTGKIIVVFGASSGYGRAAAEEMLARGASVAMAMRHAAESQHLAEKHPGIVILAELDVRDESAVHELLADVAAQFGGIDAVVNSASIGIVGEFESISLPDHREVIETDLVGTLNASYHAIAQFRVQANGGVLINVAADPASLKIPYMTSYCASKCGVVGLTAALRAEAREQGWKNIHICTVMPGDQIGPTKDEMTASGSVVSPPAVQVAVVDTVADEIANLVTSPKDEVRVMGTHYFL